MEEEKRGRGRPKIDTGFLDQYAPSRRQAMNAMYMHEGIHIITVAAADIPDSHLLWYSDDETRIARGKNGILEQLGRLVVQDHFPEEDCIYIANLAIAALKAGCKSREIEKAIRTIRMTNKKASAEPEDEMLQYIAVDALRELKAMGGVTE